MKTNWKGKRVVILGAARQGLALARYLAKHQATVILNDKRSQVEMQTEIKALANTTVEWKLGGHPNDLLEPTPDYLCISGGVPLDNPVVLSAIQKGIPLSNDTQIFLEAAPCRTIGITGSAGKTTTTTLLGRIAQADKSGKYGRVWIGGNIGDPLINYVDEMQPSDLAILEISSFQAEQMTLSSNIAAILNITPNHLDRHGSMENYTAAKAQLIKNQTPSDIAVLGRDNPAAWQLASQTPANVVSFGFSAMPENGEGAFRENGKFFFQQNGEKTHLPVEDVIELRGEHNQLNVLAACAIAFTTGLSTEAMRAGVQGFRGVPHRLEFVRTWRNAQWYNDSIATAPERTMAAIEAFSGSLILLLGGRDKNLPWNELGALIKKRVDHVVVFGEAAEKIIAGIGQRIPGSRPFSVARVEKCQDAVIAASRLAQPGFTVLFSPGGTSYDEFKDFEERGERFKQWVLELSETLR